MSLPATFSDSENTGHLFFLILRLLPIYVYTVTCQLAHMHMPKAEASIAGKEPETDKELAH